MTARLTPAAQLDALDASDWYDQRAAGTGTRFLDAIGDLVRTLEQLPQLYPRVPRPPTGREIREAPVGNFPWIATYEVTADEVVILSVTHGRSVRQVWRRRLP